MFFNTPNPNFFMCNINKSLVKPSDYWNFHQENQDGKKNKKYMRLWEQVMGGKHNLVYQKRRSRDNFTPLLCAYCRT